MPPEDVEQLIKTLQDTLAELGREEHQATPAPSAD
ncbi:hypothetical protein EDF72_1224 [Delftia acidovorans]|nr:hypothetical protein EDF72_1224 [Delftia acidovorans]